MKLEDKLFLDRYVVDSISHLKIKDQNVCTLCQKKQCLYTCPAQVYKLEEGKVVISYEGCVECGACRIICSEHNNLEWSYPRGGFGISYKYG